MNAAGYAVAVPTLCGFGPADQFSQQKPPTSVSTTNKATGDMAQALNRSVVGFQAADIAVSP